LTVHLLDVNVLIALLDLDHMATTAAWRWFDRVRGEGWATCPMTENGVIRIMSASQYRNTSSSPVQHVGALDRFCREGVHHFWPDDISPRELLVDEMQLTSAQLTDVYLLALAIEHGGKLATFDRRIPIHLLPGGKDSLEVIPQ